MPADAKLGLFIGVVLVVVAAWVYRSGAPITPPAVSASPVIEPASEPVLIPDTSH